MSFYMVGYDEMLRHVKGQYPVYTIDKFTGRIPVKNKDEVVPIYSDDGHGCEGAYGTINDRENLTGWWFLREVFWDDTMPCPLFFYDYEKGRFTHYIPFSSYAELHAFYPNWQKPGTPLYVGTKRVNQAICKAGGVLKTVQGIYVKQGGNIKKIM